MENNLDCKVVLGLKKDLNILQNKMTKALESDNVGTYINLQKALVNSLNAIKELSNEYGLMYSEYYLGENKEQKQVAVWEQNSNGDIRNHKVWNVENETSKFYKEWENRFLSEHNRGLPRTMFVVTNMTRNIGKTTFLINQAKLNDGIYLSTLGRECKRFKNGECVINRLDFEDVKRFDKNTKLYIDEGVSDESIEYVENNFNEYFIFKTIK